MGSQADLSILRSLLLFCVTGTLIASCGGNVFEGISSKTSHNAVIEQIKNLTNAQRFSEAVDIIEANPTLTTSRDEKFLFASAYAGLCGLTFAGLFDSLSTASGAPMEFAKNAFTTTTVVPAKCYTAQQWIESIGAAGVRSSNENIAMFLIGIAKVGTYLRNRADADMNGTLDPAYDSCDNTQLPRDDIKQVITGFGLMIENLAAIGTNISGGFSTSITSISAACTGLGLACNVTDPTGVSDADADSFRDAIKSDKTTLLGIETCVSVPLTTCCP